MTIVVCSNFQSGSTMEMGLTHLKNLSRSQLIGYENILHSNVAAGWTEVLPKR